MDHTMRFLQGVERESRRGRSGERLRGITRRKGVPVDVKGEDREWNREKEVRRRVDESVDD